MKILLPVDGSDYSKYAAKYLLTHKEVFGEQVSLTLLHVYPALPGHITAHIDKDALASYHEEQKGKFDMVVMGSHGRGAFSGLFLGSVARKVLAACKVPVLLVRE